MSDLGDNSFQEPIVGDPERQQRLRWWLMRLTAVSAIFSYVAVSHCSFLMLDYGASNTIFNAPQLGLFNRAVFDEGGNAYGCVSQNGDERFKDGAFGAGRAFGVMNAMVETVLIVFAFWVQLIMRPDWAEFGWKVLRSGYIVALLCQLLAFSVFASEVCTTMYEELIANMQPVPSTCSLGAASKMALINVFLLLALSIMVCLVPAPIHPYFIRWTDDEDDNDPVEEEPFTSDDDYRSGDDFDGGSRPYDSEDGIEMPKKKKKKKKKKRKKERSGESGGEETDLSKDV
ncbi:MAG: hypothetical protein SGARI_005236 [Bacillariaceae sp.]